MPSRNSLKDQMLESQASSCNRLSTLFLLPAQFQNMCCLPLSQRSNAFRSTCSVLKNADYILVSWTFADATFLSKMLLLDYIEHFWPLVNRFFSGSVSVPVPETLLRVLKCSRKVLDSIPRGAMNIFSWSRHHEHVFIELAP